jgi:hypothetical protein
MKMYQVKVEGLVVRYLSIEADNPDEAEGTAVDEFCALLGADPDSVSECDAEDITHILLR